MQQEVPSGACKWHPAQVCSALSSKIEIERGFICLSSKELKKALGVDRLTKAVVAGVPVLRMPQEGNPSKLEDTYFFQDPQQGYRRGVWKVAYEASLEEYPLQLQNHGYKLQGLKTMEHLMSVKGEEHGCRSLVEKEKLMCLTEFLQRHAKEKKEPIRRQEPIVADSSDEDDDDEDDDAGPAAEPPLLGQQSSALDGAGAALHLFDIDPFASTVERKPGPRPSQKPMAKGPGRAGSQPDRAATLQSLPDVESALSVKRSASFVASDDQQTAAPASVAGSALDGSPEGGGGERLAV